MVLFMIERTVSDHAVQVMCELKAVLLLYDSMTFFEKNYSSPSQYFSSKLIQLNDKKTNNPTENGQRT